MPLWNLKRPGRDGWHPKGSFYVSRFWNTQVSRRHSQSYGRVRTCAATAKQSKNREIKESRNPCVELCLSVPVASRFRQNWLAAPHGKGAPKHWCSGLGLCCFHLECHLSSLDPCGIKSCYFRDIRYPPITNFPEHGHEKIDAWGFRGLIDFTHLTLGAPGFHTAAKAPESRWPWQLHNSQAQDLLIHSTFSPSRPWGNYEDFVQMSYLLPT